MMCEKNLDISSLQLVHFYNPDDYIFFFNVKTSNKHEFNFIISQSRDEMKSIFDDINNNRVCLFNDHDKIKLIVVFHADHIFLKDMTLYKLTQIKDLD